MRKKMKKTGIVFLICFVLAMVCFVYAVMVFSTGSGTGFFAVWIALGLILLLAGLSVSMGVWQRVPAPVKKAAGGLIGIGFLLFVIVEGCVISQMHAPGKEGLDYILVLGAQVRKDGPSVVLKYRLDAAVQYLRDNPDTICIVSGGQGSNEPYPEAQGMALYLKEKGIDASRLLLEEESKTTEQNITNSKKLIPKGATVGIVTNNFHVFRAMQIARRCGLSESYGIAAGSSFRYLPNNMLREFFAEIKFLLA